jgi:hypothetical protein
MSLLSHHQTHNKGTKIHKNKNYLEIGRGKLKNEGSFTNPSSH